MALQGNPLHARADWPGPGAVCRRERNLPAAPPMHGSSDGKSPRSVHSDITDTGARYHCSRPPGSKLDTQVEGGPLLAVADAFMRLPVSSTARQGSGHGVACPAGSCLLRSNPRRDSCKV